MWFDIALVLATVASFFTAYTLALVQIPLAAERLGLSGLAAGALVALPGLAGLLADSPAAVLSDAIGRRPLVLAGCACGTAGAAVFYVAGDAVALFASSVLFAAMLGLAFGPLVALTTEVAPLSVQARLQGWNGAVQGGSAVVATWIAGALAEPDQIRTGFLVEAVFCLATGVLVCLAREAPRRPGERLARRMAGSYGAGVRMLRERSRVLAGASVAAIYIVVFVVVGNAFLPVYLIEKVGLSGAAAAALLSARILVLIMLSAGFGWIVRRLGRDRTLLWAHAAGAVAVVLIPIIGLVPAASVPVMICLGVGSAFGAAGANLLVSESTGPGERALGIAATNMISRSAFLVAPLAIGAAVDVASYELAFVTAGGIALVGVVALSAALRRAAASLARVG